VPEAKAGTEIVLVMDNLHEVHKMKRVRQLIEGRGCELLVVLPSYSLDSNPTRQRRRLLLEDQRLAEEGQGEEF
jgi:transposase